MDSKEPEEKTDEPEVADEGRERASARFAEVLCETCLGYWGRAGECPTCGGSGIQRIVY